MAEASRMERSMPVGRQNCAGRWGARRREGSNFGRPKFRSRPARWGRGRAGSFFSRSEAVVIPGKPKSSAGGRRPSGKGCAK